MFSKKIKISIVTVYVLSLFPLCNTTSITEICRNGEYPKYCLKAAQDPEVFKNFKRHRIYQGVVTCCNTYSRGMQFYNVLKRQFPEFINLKDRFRENDMIGNPLTQEYPEIGRFSAVTLRYLKVANALQGTFGDLQKLHIVEIGGGYGGLAKMIDVLGGYGSYTLIDLPEALELAKKYVEAAGLPNVHFEACDELDQLKDKHYDLLVSNYAYSEIDVAEQNEYITKVINNIPNGYITFNFHGPKYFGVHSLSVEEFKNILESRSRVVSTEPEVPDLTMAGVDKKNVILTWATPE